MCKISIIMPSLNVEPYIEKCMRSVVEQTLEDIEIICVDAGSTDGTIQIIKEFADADNRIKILHSNVKSYGYQLNLAIAHAQGEYIGIVETDDFIEQDLYSELYSFAKKYSVDYVKGGYKEFVENENRTIVNQYKRIHLPQEYLNCKICLYEKPEARLIDINHIWSGIYSRQFLISNKIKFNETLGASFQDTSFSILVGMVANTCVYADMAKYNYRIDNANSSVKSDSKINCIIDEFRYVAEELDRRDLLKDDSSRISVVKAKLNAYKWNYSRLTEKSAKIFFQNIQSELNALMNDDILKTELEKDSYSYLFIQILLGEKEDIPNYSENAKENTISIINDLQRNDHLALIGAGDYTNRILLLREYMGATCKVNIYDNSISKQGKLLRGFEIEPVGELKNNKSECKVVIANRNAGMELCSQIEEETGLNSDVVVYNELPLWGDMINIYLSNI